VVSTKVVIKAAGVVSMGAVAVGVPNSKIRTQTVVEVSGTASKTILGCNATARQQVGHLLGHNPAPVKI
jgi:hypothetical protein